MINSICDFSKMLKVGKTAVYSVFQKYQLTGCATKLPRLGLSRLLITVQLDGSSSRTLYQLPQTIKVTYMTGSDLTGRKIICVAELTGHQAQHNNLINGKNRRAWLGSALKHVDELVSCQNKVFWTNKTKSTWFCLLGDAQCGNHRITLRTQST